MIGTFIFATLAKFIFVPEDEFDSSVGPVDSFVLVNTSTIDVVRTFVANGLYSPGLVTLVGVGVADETTSREEEDDDDDDESVDSGGGEIEFEEELDDGGIGIR